MSAMTPEKLREHISTLDDEAIATVVDRIVDHRSPKCSVAFFSMRTGQQTSPACGAPADFEMICRACGAHQEWCCAPHERILMAESAQMRRRFPDYKPAHTSCCGTFGHSDDLLAFIPLR